MIQLNVKNQMNIKMKTPHLGSTKHWLLLTIIIINGINTEASQPNEGGLKDINELTDETKPLATNDEARKLLRAVQDPTALDAKEYVLSKDGVEEVNKPGSDKLKDNVDAPNNDKLVDNLKVQNDDKLDKINGPHEDELKAEEREDRFRIGDEMVISKNKTVSKLSDKIRKIIEHYQQEDPVGMPDSGVPDPLLVPDLEKSSMTFEDMKVHGLSQFRIVKMHTDASAMEFTLGLLFRKLEVKGNYTFSQWWSHYKGRFVVSLLDVTMEGKATLIVNMAGKLEAEQIRTDAGVASIKLDFENLGLMGTMVQGIVNTAGPFLFDSLKPQLLSEMNVKLRQMTNENLKAMKQSFEPKAGLPIDNLIHTARNAVRDRHFDPYNMKIGSPANNSLFKVEEVILHGLSDFYRIGDISLHMENKVLQLSLHLGIPLLKGRISYNLIYYRSTTCFTFKYLQLQISINQTINDLARSPQLDKVRVKIGSIKLSKRNPDTFVQKIVQAYVYNHLPNILREGVLHLMRQPLQVSIQNALDQIKLRDYLSVV